MSIQQRALQEFQRQPAATADTAAAVQLLGQLGLPQPRDEHWRNANLRAFEQVTRFLPPGASAALPALPAPLPGFQRAVFIDGRRAPQLSDAGALALLSNPAWPAPADNDGHRDDQRFALLNALFGNDAAQLDLAQDVAMEVLFIASGAAGSVYPRLAVTLAPGVRARLVERHLGATTADGFICAQTRIELQRGAHLDHYRLQDCNVATLWMDTLLAQVGEQAHYDVRLLGIGAATARCSAEVRLSGAKAALSWRSMAALDGRQVNDTLLRVTHAAPGTRTSQLFRGIAEGRARIGFDADVRVTAQAPGTRISQSLRGLIEGAESGINLRPRLTIHTDDIQASHGATTGQLDENLLFYLLSRGLDVATARALLKWAFLGDVLSAVDIPELRQQAETAAAGHLADRVLAGVLA